MHLIYMLPSSTNTTKSPFELPFNKSYDYHLLKVFACECWPYIRPYNSNFSYRSKSCVFLGYNKPHVSYICFHPPSGRVYIARHVVFNETNFPFSSISNLPIAPPSSTTTHSLPLLFASLLPATPTDSISVTIESSVPIPSVPATSMSLRHLLLSRMISLLLHVLLL
jgi:hypothetical protein